MQKYSTKKDKHPWVFLTSYLSAFSTNQHIPMLALCTDSIAVGWINRLF
jgi:hypothetical protein